MTGWQPTAALARALAVAGVGLALAVLFGSPVLAVLVAPLGLCGALGLWHRPATSPVVHTDVGHAVLVEGAGTSCDLQITGAEGVEQVTRVLARTAYVALRPADGRLATRLPPGADRLRVSVSPRRWGRRDVGDEQAALTSAWSGFRWGPVHLTGRTVTVLPTSAPFDSRAEVPRPLGVVGAHRSRRAGTGTEFSGIRPFAAGDRLRRIDWRVSLRTGALHTVDVLAEQDAGILLVVDALADVGDSGGLDGATSSLDLTVRAAAAIAEHHIRGGDRVGLRIVGGDQVERAQVGLGAGARHLRVITGSLARVRAGRPVETAAEGAPLGATAGTTVVVLSPMLQETMLGVVGSAARSGLGVLVVDTLPRDVWAGVGHLAGVDPAVVRLAWRLRLAERALLLERLAATGCPVVPWRGPGTLDEVLRRLARRARLPQLVAR